MSYAALTAFWAVSFLLVLTPGADWAYVISAGLRGRRLVLPATLGLACGALLLVAQFRVGVQIVAQAQQLGQVGGEGGRHHKKSGQSAKKPLWVRIRQQRGKGKCGQNAPL